MNKLQILPCLDSDDLAATRKKELMLSRHEATALGRSAVERYARGST